MERFPAKTGFFKRIKISDNRSTVMLWIDANASKMSKLKKIDLINMKVNTALVPVHKKKRLSIFC